MPIELGFALRKLIEFLFTSRFGLKVDIDHKPFVIGELQREHHKSHRAGRQGSCALRQASLPLKSPGLGSVSPDH